MANVIRNPGSLITIMLMLHIAIPAAAYGMGHLLFPNNMNLITGMVLEFFDSDSSRQYDVGIDL